MFVCDDESIKSTIEQIKTMYSSAHMRWINSNVYTKYHDIFPGNYKMFFKITQVASLYARVGILLTCGRHLHDHIIVLRPEVFWVHKTILTLLLFTEVHVLRLESERSCICVSGVSISPISTILIFCFEIVPTVWYFIVFHFITDRHQQAVGLCWLLKTG